MIAVDTNLLVWSHRRDAVLHQRALAAIAGLAEGATPWAIPWPCIHEFYRIVTDPRIFVPASTPAEAVGMIERWMRAPALSLIGEGPTHFEGLRKLAIAGDVRGALIHDARIAAICMSHGVKELWSADRDFSRFPALKTRNPLVA